MNQTFEGSFDGRGLKVAVVVSRFNESITKALLDRGARLSRADTAFATKTFPLHGYRAPSSCRW